MPNICQSQASVSGSKTETMKTQNTKIDRTAVKKIKLEESRSDFTYWQSRPYEERLAALETIRQEYNQWKYACQPRFQRVYRIVRQK